MATDGHAVVKLCAASRCAFMFRCQCIAHRPWLAWRASLNAECSRYGEMIASCLGFACRPRTLVLPPDLRVLARGRRHDGRRTSRLELVRGVPSRIGPSSLSFSGGMLERHDRGAHGFGHGGHRLPSQRRSDHTRGRVVPAGVPHARDLLPGTHAEIPATLVRRVVVCVCVCSFVGGSVSVCACVINHI